MVEALETIQQETNVQERARCVGTKHQHNIDGEEIEATPAHAVYVLPEAGHRKLKCNIR